MEPTKPDLLTVMEVAARLRVSRRTVYEWTKSGGLPVLTLRSGRRATLRWRAADVEKFLQRAAANG